MTTFDFTTLQGERFQMDRGLFQRLFDNGFGTDEERSHLMLQTLNQ